MKLIIAAFLMITNIYSADVKMKNFVMDKKYFSCKIPSDWGVERNKKSDIKNNIYKVILLKSDDSRTSITLKYYHPASKKDYKSFVDIQSKASDGSYETATEKYNKPEEKEINNRKAIEIDREIKDFESMESSTSGAYWLKEKIIVLPAKKGFYTLTLSSKKESFDKNIATFDKIVASFKPAY
jgi:hypothetical protein